MERPWDEPLMESCVPGRALLSSAPACASSSPAQVPSPALATSLDTGWGHLGPFLPWWVSSNALRSTVRPLCLTPAPCCQCCLARWGSQPWPGTARAEGTNLSEQLSMPRGSEAHERSSPSPWEEQPLPSLENQCPLCTALCPSAPARGGTSLAAKQLRHLILPWWGRDGHQAESTSCCSGQVILGVTAAEMVSTGQSCPHSADSRRKRGRSGQTPWSAPASLQFVFH